MFGDIYLETSHYLHIARNTPGADKIRLTVKLKEDKRSPEGFDYTITDVTADCQLTITAIGTAPVITSYNAAERLLTATGTATGENIITIKHASANDIKCKVNVHNVLSAWWLGNSSLDVPIEPRLFHCQISVLANFDADPTTKLGSIGDISGHGFVHFDLPMIDPADPHPIIELGEFHNGKIKAIWGGSTPVRAKFISHEETVNVKTTNFYGNPSDWSDPSTIQSPNEYLRRMTIEREYKNPQDPKHTRGRSIDERSNLLFIAEGFTMDQEEVFDKMVQQMTDHLFSSPSFSPYNKLGGNFNVWKAFSPSAESGITRTSKNKSSPFTVTKPGIPQTINSALGLYLSRREGDHLVTEGDQELLFLGALRLMADSGSVIADPRRYPYELNWVKAFGRHFATLAEFSNGNRVGHKWYNELPDNDPKAFLADLGLVCILVNDPANIVFQAANYGYFMVMNLKFDETIVENTQVENDASGLIWKSNTRHVTDMSKLHIDSKNYLEETTDLLAHELSHSFAIGDEYEKGGEGQVMHKTKSNFINIHTYDELAGVANSNPPQIDASKLNWNLLNRVERADKILQIVVDDSDPNVLQLTFTLDSSNAKRWKSVQQAGRKLALREFRPVPEPILFGYGGLNTWIRHFNHSPRPPAASLIIINDLEIMNIPSKNQLKLKVNRSSLPASVSSIPAGRLQENFSVWFSPNGCLFLPLLYKNGPNVNKPVTLIDYEVLEFMTTSKAPLHTNWDATGTGSCSLVKSNQPVNSPPKGITVTSKRKYPRHDFTMIGAYEGGDHSSCKVYRPAGSCKMRNQLTGSTSLQADLCYHCKYYITNHVNPAALEWIEKEYPALK